VLGKIILLAVITAIAVWLAIPLIGTERWSLLILVIVTTVLLYVIFLQPWHIPIKYIIPGTIFLIAFQVVPVVFTASTALTNFGDGHRGTKEDAIASIERGRPAGPSSREYVLTIAAEATRRPATSCSCSSTRPRRPLARRRRRPRALPDAVVNERGKVTSAPRPDSC
jgi:arabinogalactan oligomer/maltooligosaccharide transport system permease protein